MEETCKPSREKAATALKALKYHFDLKDCSSQERVFAMAREIVAAHGGRALSDKPGAIDGWLVDFLYFTGSAEGDGGDFLYVMLRDNKDGEADLGLALDSYPTTPPWLKEMAWSLLNIKNSAKNATKSLQK